MTDTAQWRHARIVCAARNGDALSYWRFILSNGYSADINVALPFEPLALAGQPFSVYGVSWLGSDVSRIAIGEQDVTDVIREKPAWMWCIRPLAEMDYFHCADCGMHIDYSGNPIRPDDKTPLCYACAEIREDKRQ